MTNIIREEKLRTFNYDDKRISIALMSSFVILTIQYLILIYFNLLESSIGSNIQLLSKGLVGIIYIYAFPSTLKRSRIRFIVVNFIALFAFLIHFVIFPANRDHIVDLLFPFFFMCLPTFVYTLSIQNFAIFEEAMRKSSYIVFITGLLLGVLIFSRKASVGSYSMSLSYYMLLPALLFLDKLMERFSLKTFIPLILSLLIILSLGSRGAILCILVFIFFKFFSPYFKKSYKKIIIRVALLMIGFIILIFLDNIIESLYNFLLSFGINSRTLILFLEDGVHLSGRDTIYKNTIAEILKSPLIGIGIAGDRRITDGYAHNFFIEMIGGFGLIIGSIICISIIFLVIKSLLTKDKEKYDLTIMWLSLGFVHLMVSSSYLIDIKFWILMGLLMNCKFSKLSVKFLNSK